MYRGTKQTSVQILSRSSRGSRENGVNVVHLSLVCCWFWLWNRRSTLSMEVSFFTVEYVLSDFEELAPIFFGSCRKSWMACGKTIRKWIVLLSFYISVGPSSGGGVYTGINYLQKLLTAGISPFEYHEYLVCKRLCNCWGTDRRVVNRIGVVIWVGMAELMKSGRRY